MSELKVFLSYAQSDRTTAKSLTKALETRGVEVWDPDVESLARSSIAESIRRNLLKSDAVVVLLSRESMDAPAILFEAGAAIGQGKKVVVVTLSPRTNDLLPRPLWEVWQVPAVHKGPAQIADQLLPLIAAPQETGLKQKSAARKSTARKSTARKSAARKSAARKSTARKSAARKSTARKSTARKSTAR